MQEFTAGKSARGPSAIPDHHGTATAIASGNLPWFPASSHVAQVVEHRHRAGGWFNYDAPIQTSRTVC